MSHKQEIATKQQGSTLVISLFVIIVFLLLGGALTRIISVGDRSLAYEVIGIRAYAAAHAGAERGLQLLFPLNPSGAGAELCSTHFTEPSNTLTLSSISGAVGLVNCGANIKCIDYEHDDNDNGVITTFYRIESTGQCALDGTNKTSRTIVVEARNL